MRFVFDLSFKEAAKSFQSSEDIGPRIDDINVAFSGASQDNMFTFLETENAHF